MTEKTVNDAESDFSTLAICFVLALNLADHLTNEYVPWLDVFRKKHPTLSQVYLALLDAGEPIQVKRLAELTKMSSNVVSALLTRLRKMNLAQKRGKLYEAADPRGQKNFGDHPMIVFWWKVRQGGKKAAFDYAMRALEMSKEPK